MVKNIPTNSGEVRIVGLIPRWEDALKEIRATHSSIFAWRNPWTERSLEVYSSWDRK